MAYARDPGLFNAVLNVFFDPLTAKRRSFKDIMGEKRKPKKNVQTAYLGEARSYECAVAYNV